MELGMIGLGRMGGNMVQRLLNGGHRVVTFDRDAEAVAASQSQGAVGVSSPNDLVTRLAPPRSVWVMVPAGQPTEDTIDSLIPLMDAGDVVLDGGNANYKDSMRRAEKLAGHDIDFVDVGTSGGIWGLAEGYSLMIGGKKEVFQRLEPIFQTLAPGEDKGYSHVGPAGAGHFVKMVHNGIEYGMMQAYAEGFEIMEAKKEFVATLAEDCLGTQGRFSAALSGGSTPLRLYQVLASPPHAEGMALDRWHVFWSDERCVPPDHEDSNFRMAREALLDHVPKPPAQVYHMRGEVAPEEAAKEYESLVLDLLQTPVPAFDLILLGIGDDGHTASLFPGTEALQENHRLVVSNWAPTLQAHRITFTLPLINAAMVVAFLDTDESKAKVLRRVLEPAPEEDVLPAAMVRPTDGTIHWFLTKEAASLLGTTDA